MLSGGCLWSLGSAAVDLAIHGIVTDVGSVAGASTLAVAGSAMRGVGWLIVIAGVPMAFPDSRFLSHRWRFLPGLLILAGAATVLGGVTAGDANLLGLGALGQPGRLARHDRPSGQRRPLLDGRRARARRHRWCCCRPGPQVFPTGTALDRQPILMLAAAAGLVAPRRAVGRRSTGAGWAFSVAALPLPFVIGLGVLAQGVYDLKTAANRTLAGSPSLRWSLASMRW